MRNGSRLSGKGPAEHFTGTVRVDPLFKAPASARVRCAYHLRAGRPHRLAHASAWSNPDRHLRPRLGAAQGRADPGNLPGDVVCKQAAPAQIALAWLMAQKPWIVPIPGTTEMVHLLQNIGAAAVRFTPSEVTELNASVSAIDIQGARLPDAVLVFSGVEAPGES